MRTTRPDFSRHTPFTGRILAHVFLVKVATKKVDACPHPLLKFLDEEYRTLRANHEKLLIPRTAWSGKSKKLPQAIAGCFRGVRGMAKELHLWMTWGDSLLTKHARPLSRPAFDPRRLRIKGANVGCILG